MNPTLMGARYNQIRAMIDDKFAVHIEDRAMGNMARVIIFNTHNRHMWVEFGGKDIVEALDKALYKLQNPDSNYIDEYGNQSPQGI